MIGRISRKPFSTREKQVPTSKQACHCLPARHIPDLKGKVHPWDTWIDEVLGTRLTSRVSVSASRHCLRAETLVHGPHEQGFVGKGKSASVHLEIYAEILPTASESIVSARIKHPRSLVARLGRDNLP